MYWMVAIMTASLLGVVGMGVYLEYRPVVRPPRVPWLRGAVLSNLILFFAAEMGLLFLGVQDALAQPAAAGGGPVEVSVGLGLALIGIGIPTAVATIGAGIAVGPVGSSAMALISEKPEMFGRTLVYLGLAEGIAIYGLVVSILMLGRI
jgi:V/A-type H+-transporting ATPase subunit K